MTQITFQFINEKDPLAHGFLKTSLFFPELELWLVEKHQVKWGESERVCVWVFEYVFVISGAKTRNSPDVPGIPVAGDLKVVLPYAQKTRNYQLLNRHFVHSWKSVMEGSGSWKCCNFFFIWRMKYRWMCSLSLSFLSNGFLNNYFYICWGTVV